MSEKKQDSSEEECGPLGDVQPGRNDSDPRTRGGQPQEKVEDRPNVGTVEPEDYPDQA